MSLPNRRRHARHANGQADDLLQKVQTIHDLAEARQALGNLMEESRARWSMSARPPPDGRQIGAAGEAVAPAPPRKRCRSGNDGACDGKT